VQGITMPLSGLSGILLPMALAPDWLQSLSSSNPLTHAVDAVRAVFNGHWGGREIVIGTVVTGMLAVFVIRFAGRSFTRANA